MHLLKEVSSLDYSEIGTIIKSIYELESDGLSRSVMEEDFQIHKLYPECDVSPYETEIYPIYYYRDKKGNEILVNHKNDINVKLSNKHTILFNEENSFGEEKEYLEKTINDLENKVLVKK